MRPGTADCGRAENDALVALGFEWEGPIRWIDRDGTWRTWDLWRTAQGDLLAWTRPSSHQNGHGVVVFTALFDDGGLLHGVWPRERFEWSRGFEPGPDMWIETLLADDVEGAIQVMERRANRLADARGVFLRRGHEIDARRLMRAARQRSFLQQASHARVMDVWNEGMLSLFPVAFAVREAGLGDDPATSVSLMFATLFVGFVGLARSHLEGRGASVGLRALLFIGTMWFALLPPQPIFFLYLAVLTGDGFRWPAVRTEHPAGEVVDG